MRTTLFAALVAGTLSLPAAVVAADASPHSFTGNVGFATDYVFRGISQTSGKPALQGGFDYAHSSGLYAGTWASNISWIADGNPGAASPNASLEIDLYGGYKGTISGDLGFDVGLMTYNYPGSNKTVGGTILKQDTQEVYGALSYKWLTVKYSQSTGALFGWAQTAGVLQKTTGSGYLEANAALDLGNGWGLGGHVGHQTVKGRSTASYTDYKIGVTKDAGYGVFGLAATSTNTKGDCGSTPVGDYCWGAATAGAVNYNAGKSTLVATFNKSF
ncbi:MAG: TorF family putative porin [Sulfuritalea sp.]|nr:TorF family putative porin [Sulfuritalea sp.]